MITQPDQFLYRMNPIQFRLLRDFIYRQCGLWFDDSQMNFFKNRLVDRLKALDITSFNKYYYYILYDKNRDEEFLNIIDILTTNETYFFREKSQLKAFSEEILPLIRQDSRGTESPELKIWSAGCSTGEEAYTVAMLILETKQFPGWDIDILATDISPRVLSIGRKGIYSKSSFRSCEPYYIDKYFTKDEFGYRIKDSVRRYVDFARLNLLDKNRLNLIRNMDVIFCRNVIIYFDLEAKKKVIESLYDCLKPNGFLLLGHSESLASISTKFELRHFQYDMVYQKKKL